MIIGSTIFHFFTQLLTHLHLRFQIWGQRYGFYFSYTLAPHGRRLVLV